MVKLILLSSVLFDELNNELMMLYLDVDGVVSDGELGDAGKRLISLHSGKGTEREYSISGVYV